MPRDTIPAHMIQSESTARQALQRIEDDDFPGAVRAMAGSQNQSKLRIARSALLVAAALTQLEREALVDWLEGGAS